MLFKDRLWVQPWRPCYLRPYLVDTFKPRRLLFYNHLGTATDLCSRKVDVAWCSALTQSFYTLYQSALLCAFLLGNHHSSPSHSCPKNQHSLKYLAFSLGRFSASYLADLNPTLVFLALILIIFRLDVNFIFIHVLWISSYSRVP